MGGKGDSRRIQSHGDVQENDGKPWTRAARSTVFATPEIRTLFEEWARQMDEELLGLLDEGEPSDLDQLAARLKISKESLIFFLARLARKGEIGLRPERVNKS